MALVDSPNASLVGAAGSRWRLNTPALVLDLDAMERNIDAMAAHCRATGQQLRPHAKSHKSVSIARAQKAAGALGVCCATIREAEVMVEAGIDGVLITSPLSSGPKIERLLALHQASDSLMAVTDTPENVSDLIAASASSEAPHPLTVVVDFDVGTHRTGAADRDAVVTLARQIDESESLRYGGIQAYYGHIQHIEGYDQRRLAASEQAARLKSAVAALRDAGLDPEIVTGGGTGTYDIDHREGVFSELQAGSYIFTDVQYNACALSADEPRPFEPSLFVHASVVNDVHDSHAIIDAGLKSFATDGPVPEFASRAPVGASYRFYGDEHGGVVYGDANERLGVGAQLACLVPHCDPTVNLYDAYHCVRGDRLVDIWPIEARGNP